MVVVAPVGRLHGFRGDKKIPAFPDNEKPFPFRVPRGPEHPVNELRRAENGDDLFFRQSQRAHPVNGNSLRGTGCFHFYSPVELAWWKSRPVPRLASALKGSDFIAGVGVSATVAHARVGRAMDVAVPHELNTKAQWELVRGFGLQLRDTYGVALCVSLHHPNTKGDQRNVHGHIFMTTRAVDAEGNFSKAKIRNFDDRKLGPLEIERIREMWETRCNRALRKAGVSEGVNRRSLQAQGIDRPATKHLGAKASAMARNGCRLRKDEINKLISSDSRRLAEINTQLDALQNYGHREPRKQSVQPQIRAGEKSDLAETHRLHPSKSKHQTHRVAVSGEPGVAHHGNRHARNRSRTRPARPNTAGELVGFLARGASIGRIAQGHHFRGGQLLVGLLRTLRIVIRALEIEQQRQQQRAGIRMRL